MAVTVEIPVSCRRFAANESSIQVDPQSTVTQTLATGLAVYPKLQKHLTAADGQLFGFVRVFHNGSLLSAEKQQAVSPKSGDVITLVSAVAGG